MADAGKPGTDLKQALNAQSPLRGAANLPPETPPLFAFVGMISDGIEALRESGKSDDDIALLIRTHSTIDITADKLARLYDFPSERQHGHEPSDDVRLSRTTLNRMDQACNPPSRVLLPCQAHYTLIYFNPKDIDVA